jgi:hypothetical protein
MSLSVTGGLGTILSIFFDLYGAEGYGIQTITLLATLPALMTGIMFSCRTRLPLADVRRSLLHI